jgi:hypothetical protein
MRNAELGMRNKGTGKGGDQMGKLPIGDYRFEKTLFFAPKDARRAPLQSAIRNSPSAIANHFFPTIAR